MTKISALNALTSPAPEDEFPINDISASSQTKRLTLANMMKTIYPVGSIYMNATDGTDPSSLLGFGTWSIFGAGRVPVGIDSTDPDFDTAGATIGEKKHFHWQTVGSDAADIYAQVNGSGSGHTTTVNVDRTAWGAASRANTTMRQDGTYDESSIQPSIVVYMWQRIS